MLSQDSQSGPPGDEPGVVEFVEQAAAPEFQTSDPHFQTSGSEIELSDAEVTQSSSEIMAMGSEVIIPRVQEVQNEGIPLEARALFPPKETANENEENNPVILSPGE
jgi:hypothetical protein